MRRGAVAAGLCGLLLSITASARADVTVVGHYTLATGDTLTRASYYTSKRLRTTLPDGDEILYDDKSKRITLIDHERKLYWQGPRAQADSIAGRLRAERAKAARDSLTAANEKELQDIYYALTSGLHVWKPDSSKKIAGYPCSKWMLAAGNYLWQERWVARSLAVPNFGPEVEKVVIASVMDPLGSGLMKLVIQARDVDGLTLAGSIRYKTLRREGTMSWRAVKVSSGRVPDTAWAIPHGYAAWQPPPATPQH